ncbi:MAG: ImmA/IrrE family metallo-endopeptidase [Pseudomonadota bacterium]
MDTIPVDVYGLIREMGLRIFEATYEDDDISGQIIRDEENNSYIIYVNAGHSHTRKRFTAAHELGHYVLHRDQIGDGITDDALYRSRLSNPTEWEANRFAADILMPRDKVDYYASINGNNISILANIFQVSEQAMAIRLS